MSSENIVTHVQNISPRGFRSFQNYRIRILFHCGKLNSPDESNKAPRGKPLGINTALQAAGFKPAFATRDGELNPQRLKNHHRCEHTELTATKERL